MAHPLVSVVMPLFNSAEYVGEAIQSVIDQSFHSWELIVSDDGSSDGSMELVQQFASGDSRIKIEKSLERQGPAGARNRAIARATGQWIAFLDSDDCWHPEKLSMTLDFARSRNLALVYTAYYRESAGSRRKVISVPPDVSYAKLLKSNFITTSTVMVNREWVAGFSMNEHFKFDDYVAWLEILKAQLPAGGLLEPLTTYRRHEGSFSNNKFEAARRVFVIFSNQQRLPMPKVAWYFVNYLIRGMVKHSPLGGRPSRESGPL